MQEADIRPLFDTFAQELSEKDFPVEAKEYKDTGRAEKDGYRIDTAEVNFVVKLLRRRVDYLLRLGLGTKGYYTSVSFAELHGEGYEPIHSRRYPISLSSVSISVVSLAPRLHDIREELVLRHSVENSVTLFLTEFQERLLRDHSIEMRIDEIKDDGRKKERGADLYAVTATISVGAEGSSSPFILTFQQDFRSDDPIVRVDMISDVSTDGAWRSGYAKGAFEVYVEPWIMRQLSSTSQST